MMSSETDLKTTPCLSDLEMADLVANLLEGDAREEALRHVARCEDCYEIYADAQACLEDLEEEALHEEARDEEEESEAAEEGATVLPFSSRPTVAESTPPPASRRTSTPWIPAALAASLLIGVGLATIWPDGSRQDTATQWASFAGVPSFETRLAPEGLTPLPSLSTVRGTQNASRIAGDFRLGAAWAHFGAALDLGVGIDEALTTELREWIDERVESGDLSPELGGDLNAVLNLDAASADATVEYRSATARLSEEMALLGYELDLGRFAETGRLAAEAGFYGWFAPEGEAERYLREMQATETTREAARGLEAIREAWPSDEADEKGFGEVTEAFADLILVYDAQSL